MTEAGGRSKVAQLLSSYMSFPDAFGDRTQSQRSNLALDFIKSVPSIDSMKDMMHTTPARP